MMQKISSNSNRGNHVSTPSYRANPAFLPCSSCGSQERKLGAGKEPGGASLLCECGKFIKWISANEVKAIASQLSKGGQQ